MSFKLSLVFLTICIGLGACEKADEPQQNGGYQSGILGLWQGIIKAVEGDYDVITDISLKLSAAGDFELNRIGKAGSASGVYDDFPQLQSLTLRVQVSELEELAIAGAIVDYEYQLYEGELLLTGKNHLLRLKRPDATLESPEEYRWFCQQGGVEWLLNFSGQQFLLYHENHNGASIFLKGSFAITEEEPSPVTERAIVLYVEDGQPVIPFVKLTGLIYLEQGAATAIELVPTDENHQTLEVISCQKPDD